MEVIHAEEVANVAFGSKWFNRLCGRARSDPNQLDRCRTIRDRPPNDPLVAVGCRIQHVYVDLASIHFSPSSAFNTALLPAMSRGSDGLECKCPHTKDQSNQQNSIEHG